MQITHTATGGDKGGAALYWVSDEPLMRYLGTLPEEQKFEPTMWTKAALLDRVEEIRHTPGATELNRCVHHDHLCVCICNPTKGFSGDRA